MAAACTQGKRTQHGKPQREVRDDQPDAREGQAGRAGVAERLAVPLKPGNYALYGKISREDILAHAYAQCRSNKSLPLRRQGGPE